MQCCAAPFTVLAREQQTGRIDVVDHGQLAETLNSMHAYTEMTQRQEEVVEEDCAPMPWYNWNLVTHGGSAIVALLLHSCNCLYRGSIAWSIGSDRRIESRACGEALCTVLKM